MVEVTCGADGNIASGDSRPRPAGVHEGEMSAAQRARANGMRQLDMRACVARERAAVRTEKSTLGPMSGWRL